MPHWIVQATLYLALVGVTFGLAPVSALAMEWRNGSTGHAHRYAALAASHAGHSHAAHAHAAHNHPDRSHHAMQELPAAGSRAAVSANAELTPLLGNLGSHHRAVTTTSELAQRYFDEGLILVYGFNHAEAIRSFNDALTVDPACAMCHWGIALALGPNINAPMDPSAVPDALASLEKAAALAPAGVPVEQALIRALGTRYTAAPDADRALLDLAYANAMRDLARQYPDDLDIQTLFAEALMDLTPWQFWTADGQPTEYTAEIVSTLEAVLARAPEHPGANHYYIHAVEASRTPERALPSAQRLETLVPGAGHLTHMPAHVYWRVGRYYDAARVNEQAIQVDEATFRRGVSGADQGSHSYYALAYYPHNIHFLFAAAHMQGRGELAMTSARKLVSVIPEQAYREVPALEDFRPMPLFAMVRFGLWDSILAEPAPPAELQYTTGIWHWARGLAYLRTGQTVVAEQEYQRLAAIAQTDAMKELSLASFPKAATLLEIATHVLGGELARGRGDVNEAIERLDTAVRIQDGLAYIEPPAWFYPARHNLGAVLLDAERAAQAEAVYREDLRHYPDNGWSLIGLAKSLRAQNRVDEAMAVEKQLADVWKHADVTLGASRF